MTDRLNYHGSCTSSMNFYSIVLSEFQSFSTRLLNKSQTSYEGCQNMPALMPSLSAQMSQRAYFAPPSPASDRVTQEAVTAEKVALSI